MSEISQIAHCANHRIFYIGIQMDDEMFVENLKWDFF